MSNSKLSNRKSVEIIIPENIIFICKESNISEENMAILFKRMIEREIEQQHDYKMFMRFLEENKDDNEDILKS